MGGEITATHLGGYDYEVSLTTYRDTLGIPMQTWATFEISDTSGYLFDSTVDYDTITSGALMPLFPYGVEIYYYKDTITLPGPGSYTIGWHNCCRNGAIINAASPLSESMYLTCDITAYDPAVTTNSSPVFLNQPVVFMPVGAPWSYNPLPFDPDGDSLAWSIGVPQDYWDGDIDGYYLPPGDTLDPFSIDPVTGTVTWTPIMEGNFVASIVVDEYRGGVHIGSIVRDMQMIVVPNDDSLARFSNLDALPTNDDGYYYAELRTGEEYTLSLIGEDPDLGDELSMAATGEPFLFPLSPAEFDFDLTGVNNEIEGVFSWTPALYQARPENYIVVFRLDDGIFATDLAMLFRVDEGSTGISDPNRDAGISLFPNPANGPVTVRIDQPWAGDATLFVFDAQGRLALAPISNTLSAGKHDIVINHDLAPGQYWIAIERGAWRTARPLVIH
jgi:hypothetical protein